jgi:hypothetical protein
MTAVLLAACLTSPLFDMSGPPCAQPFTQCGCSECMVWTPNATTSRYEIMRHEPGGFTRIVGTSKILPVHVDEDTGAVTPADPQELWCFAWDVPFLVEGATYSYEVRGCNGAGCGEWSGLNGTTTYVAAPYVCWRNGAREVCQ